MACKCCHALDQELTMKLAEDFQMRYLNHYSSKGYESVSCQISFTLLSLGGHRVSNFFGPPTFTADRFATPLAAIMHDILFESPQQGWFAGFLVKNVAALLRHFFSSQSTPTFILIELI